MVGAFEWVVRQLPRGLDARRHFVPQSAGDYAYHEVRQKLHYAVRWRAQAPPLRVAREYKLHDRAPRRLSAPPEAYGTRGATARSASSGGQTTCLAPCCHCTTSTRWPAWRPVTGSSQ